MDIYNPGFSDKAEIINRIDGYMRMLCGLTGPGGYVVHLPEPIKFTHRGLELEIGSFKNSLADANSMELDLTGHCKELDTDSMFLNTLPTETLRGVIFPVTMILTTNILHANPKGYWKIVIANIQKVDEDNVNKG